MIICQVCSAIRCKEWTEDGKRKKKSQLHSSMIHNFIFPAFFLKSTHLRNRRADF